MRSGTLWKTFFLIFLLLSNILVICHITLLLLLLLLLSLRAVVSAISAFLTLGTHFSRISLFNTCFNIVLFGFLNKLLMIMMMILVTAVGFHRLDILPGAQPKHQITDRRQYLLIQ